MRRLAVLAGVAVFAALAVSGCTGTPTPQIPTARSGPPSATTGPPGPAGQELQFVACMRQHGVADMPDPVPGDSSGRSAVRYALDVMGKGSDEAFQAALDTCMSLLPQVDVSQPASSAQQQRDLAFAKCMRDHGVSDFPDDIPYSGKDAAIWFSDSPKDPHQIQATKDAIVVNLGNATAKAAFDACQADWLKTGS